MNNTSETTTNEGGLDYLKTEPNNKTAAPQDVVELKLSDGRIARVEKGRGKHAMEALKIANGDQSKYLAALISQLVTIDGAPVVIEDLEWMSIPDYLALQGEFAAQNF